MKVNKISERYEISEGGYKILVTNLNGFWEITNYNDEEEFVFKNDNNPETLKKWSTVAKLIIKTTKLMEEE